MRNKPTGTVPPQADIGWLVDHKPAGSIVMIDEAYTHIAGAPFNSALAAKDKDVVILRTFSKIYGMAGLRARAATGRPGLLEKISQVHANPMPIHRLAPVHARPGAKELV